MICEVNVLKFERSEEGKDTGCNLSTDFQRSIFTIATSLELADFAKLDVECVSEQVCSAGCSLRSMCSKCWKVSVTGPDIKILR